MIDRRTLVLRSGLTALALGTAPRMVFARAETDQRFIFIIQRGAADGLGIIAPIGDPAFTSQRGKLAADFASAPRLDNFFALHPVMTNIQTLYKEKQALFAHAIASPYRDRSHFDGQNVLETGGDKAYHLKDGWLNRMLALVPSGAARAIAVSAIVPMGLRGKHDVASYAPSALPDASDDLLTRVSAMYEADAQLHALWSEALSLRKLTGDPMGEDGHNAAATGTLAAQLLSAAAGARIAMIETGGWDTHSQQASRLTTNLKGLDAMIGALRVGLGPIWSNTTVLIATEFGRTVKVNGSGGTDHGTAAAVMLLGGRVMGGRVLADWPGLATNQLYESRDLKPTMNLDSIITSSVASIYNVDPDLVARSLFPTVKIESFRSGLINL